MNLLSKLQADARTFVAALMSPSPEARHFAASWPAETPVATTAKPPLKLVATGSPEHAAQIYFDQHAAFYSEDFRAGFDYTARLLLGRAAKHKPQLPMPSARYDAFQYGCAEAQEFLYSEEWKRVIA